MQIVKSIKAREFFRKFPEVKKQLCVGGFWSDGGYVGTVGDGIIADTIRNYVETQGIPEGERKIQANKLARFRLISNGTKMHPTPLLGAPPQF